MVRQRIEIKKINNITARQVTFSKRRRGLFKKAQELSILCDAQIGLIVFSTTGKLFDFSSSRMVEVIQTYMMQTEGARRPENSSIQQQSGDSTYDMLSKELDEKTQELRRLRGDELEGLDIEELCKLERQIERGQARVRQIKFDKLHKELVYLKRKEALLMGENGRLKEKQCDRGESINENCCSSNPLKDDMISDTSLRLGLPTRDGGE